MYRSMKNTSHKSNKPVSSTCSRHTCVSAIRQFWKPGVIVLIVGLMLFFGYGQYVKAQRKAHRKNTLAKCYLDISKDIKLPETLPRITPNAIDALQMPYYYLGKGKQALAFASVDGKYVLKLIKWPKKHKKQAALSFSVSLAGTKLQSQSGIIAIQYGPKSQDFSSLPTVQIMDKRGKITFVDLKKCLFVLQKRAPYPLKETLLKLRWKKRLEEGKAVIHSLFTLLHEIRSKEIIDLDGALIRNGNIALLKIDQKTYKAISIDIGKYSMARKDEITKNDLKRLRPFLLWLKAAWPELVPSYIEYEKKYSEGPLS